MYSKNISKLFFSLLLSLMLAVWACSSTTVSTENGSGDDNNSDGDEPIYIPPDGDREGSDIHVDGDTDGDAVESADEEQPDICGAGDDEKEALKTNKIYGGVEGPELFEIPEAQKMSIGALIGRSYGWSNFCTATLIADNAVLSAAHCVRGGFMQPDLKPEDVKFIIGRDALNPDYSFEVSAIFDNPDYDKGDSDYASHDQSILILSESVSASIPGIMPIPYNAAALGNGFVGSQVQNVGYGTTDKPSGDSNSERWWTVELVDSLETNSFTVNGEGTHGVCFGDSGGPSLYMVNGTLKVIGTVSWGDENCVGYDHYARTDRDIEWIMQYVEPVEDCGDLDEVGECVDGTARWCADGSLMAENCPQGGEVCGEDEDGNNRCLPDPCKGVTRQGSCWPGDVAVWCEDGEIKERHCRPCGQICDWTGPALGYYCSDEAGSGKSRVESCMGDCSFNTTESFCVGTEERLCFCDGVSETWQAIDCDQVCAEQSMGKGYCTKIDGFDNPQCICEEDYDPGDCGSLGYAGCCDGDKVTWCENGSVISLDCMAGYGEECGWVDSVYGYFCGGSGADPSGTNPLTCGAE